MWKPKKNKSVRLEKKESIREKFQKWKTRNQPYINILYGIFVILGIIFALILFVWLILTFAPGTESGEWYNGLRGVI